MANVLYDNFVLEAKLKDLLDTKLSAKNYMTVDNSLTESPGMVKNINTYTYTGTVEKLGKGEKNSSRGVLTYTTSQYTVELAQQVLLRRGAHAGPESARVRHERRRNRHGQRYDREVLCGA